MQFKNTPSSYGIIAILFHWLIAILLIGMIILGLYMSDLPISFEKLKLYGWHKETGMLILMLAILRTIWRVSNQLPYLALARWEVIAARTVHWAFYFFMFALPITGWMISSSANIPVAFFGLFVFPDLVAPKEEMIKTYSQIHEYLAYGLIGAIVLHVCAALKHHFINKDDILLRMINLPRR